MSTDTTEVDDLQRLYAETAGKPYVFTWADRQWTLPHARELDFELLTRVSELDPTATEADTVNELFDKILGPDQAPAWRAVVRPLPMMLMLIDRWLTHSGADQGESSASDGSSGSTRGRSKRTSTGSTASASPRRSRAKKAAAIPPANSST